MQFVRVNSKRGWHGQTCSPRRVCLGTICPCKLCPKNIKMIKLREMEDGIVVSVKVQPNSSKDRVVGKYADQIKIAVTVAPEKGKANKAVIKLFAKWLGIKNSDIQIISGETSRDKELFIRNITEEDLNKLVSHYEVS